MALPDAVEQVLRPYLDKRRNIPGFCHRFHKRDPRAVRLLALTEAAAARGEVSGRFVAIGRGIEAWRGAQKKTVLPMNIDGATARSEEHTSELQSLMRISYAVFCLKQKKNQHKQ